MMYATAFLVSFVYIYLKAWQQINVIRKQYRQIIPVSFMMALCEVSIVGLVVNTSFWLFIPIGAGASFGCLLSVWKNNR